jgi:Xaa-Pro aminopeptidase
MSIQQEKLRAAQQILSDKNIPIWLIYEDHGNDPTFKLLTGKEPGVPALLVLSPKKKRLIVNTLDVNNFADWGEDIRPYSGRQFREVIPQVLRELGFRREVAVNYSTSANGVADLMRAGQRDIVDKLVGENFPGAVKGGSIRDVVVSAEDIIYTLYDRKTPEELRRMGLAAVYANDILREAFGCLRPGMTDEKGAEIAIRIAEQKVPDYLKKAGVVAVERAWPGAWPIVLTGKSFIKGGHAETCGEIMKPGNTVYFDFGVKLVFRDGTHYCSDIQRMGYVLRESERRPSREAQGVFNILYDAVSLGIESLRPSAHGYDVDRLVRKYIQDEGKSDYDHATGHPIGQNSHNPGTVISMRRARKGPQNLFIQPNGVYTIEPRIPIENGGSIEEMVWVNPKGHNKTLCPRQERLYLIRAA